MLLRVSSGRALLQDHDTANRLGKSARSHTLHNFSRAVFGQKLVQILSDMTFSAGNK